jgi:hypothetical protein
VGSRSRISIPTACWTAPADGEVTVEQRDGIVVSGPHAVCAGAILSYSMLPVITPVDPLRSELVVHHRTLVIDGDVVFEENPPRMLALWFEGP